MMQLKYTIRRGSKGAPYKLVTESGEVLTSGSHAHCKEEQHWCVEHDRLDARWIQGPPITIALVHAPA